MRRTFAIAVVALLAVFAWTEWRFGSLGNARAYYRGETVRATEPTRDLGTLKPDQVIEVAFDLTNLERQEVRIVGADCTCPRLCATNAPFTIPPRGIAAFKVMFHAPDTRDFKESFNVFVDGPGEPIRLTVFGHTQ